MRKFLLITSILVAATSAQAMQTRGLVAPGSNTQTAQLQIDEPKQSVADQLKAIGEAPKQSVSEQASAAPAAAQTPAAAASPVATPAATSASSANARAEVEPASKPVKKAKAQRRETDEQKARRIAARYGISW